MLVIDYLKKLKENYIKRRNFDNLTSKLDNGEILNSFRFKQNDINKCFADRKKSLVDSQILDRIIKSYNKAKETQNSFPSAYQVGNEWLPIYNRYMSNIRAALQTGDKNQVNSEYENFMREDCSMGLHGLPTDMKKYYFSGNISNIDREIFLHDVVYRYNHWEKLTNFEFNVDDLEMPDFGNPYGHFVDNRFVRVGAEYMHYYAHKIESLLLDVPGKKVVAEMGGGYGGLGYFLSKGEQKNLTYIDFDLPENMALTAYYLLNSCPDKKVCLYGEEDLNLATIQDFDIIIMPNFELSRLPDTSVNLFFNSYSLAEMSTETINTYVPEFKRATANYILHINHTELSHSLKADDFGFEDEFFQLEYKKPALWNLGRDLEMDEFEYLYRRG